MPNLSRLVPVAAHRLARRHRIGAGGARQPIDRADERADGRLSTHSPVRIMFSVVLELRASPSMQRQPTHHADDIGARLNELSSLVEPIRTTGVPK